ncbi:MAG: hypothetical protein BJ554DRAFT_452 [Olpidium bornovanus]|uniref:BRCT domain-containing protein n=1 Tax=Olpidium bornovanus TaxID=278681 RepID=A0A8H8DMH3_9FUNG|nr:MAG: hypothetical protein BJ554DRAFT_452 [Olpidium bornovanus]
MKRAAPAAAAAAAPARRPAADSAGRAQDGRAGTPLPGGVLGGVVAHVHVITDDDADASSGFAADLQALGAKTLCGDCTHLVVQNPTAAIRNKYAAMLARKQTDPAAGAESCSAAGAAVPVSVLWVTECKRRGERGEGAIRRPSSACTLFFRTGAYPTAHFAYAGIQKRKSMEPTKVSDASAGEDRFSSTQHTSGSSKHRSLETPSAAETHEPPLRRTLLAPPPLILPAGPAARPDAAEAVEAAHPETRPAAELGKSPEAVAVLSPQISSTVENLAAGKTTKRKVGLQGRGVSASAVLAEVDGNKRQTAARRRRSDPASKKGEAEFELNEAFPACRKSRLLFAKTLKTEDGTAGSARGLLSELKIFVGRTKAPWQEVNRHVYELVAFLGGKPVESSSLADFCIGLGVVQNRKLLPRGPYAVSPSKAAALNRDRGGEKEEVEDGSSTGDDDSGSFSGGDAQSDYNCSGGESGTPKRKCGGSEGRRRQGPPATPSPTANAGPASTLSPQF